ncbi:trypsin-like peptidase domain-containing protein [Microcoleus sp. Pol17_C1]|uniref:trypsin-like peptidase domain-containing protein n=1 Tax=unclassified Microcoleus TaxID=2642155 RepID=UPI00403F7E59
MDQKISGGGSRFIITKQGPTYTVLTANHVVAAPDTYTIRTSTGKDYQVTRSVLLQTGQNAPDLAVVTFKSTKYYPVVTLGDSEQATVGTPIFVFGYPGFPASITNQTERNFEFSSGFDMNRALSLCHLCVNSR